METTFTAFLKKVEVFFLYAIIALVPLVFSPATSEAFELPKYTVFYACTFAALMCFLGRAMLLKHFSWRRTPLDVPLLLLWAALFIGSCLSLAPYESFFGDFPFLGISFLTVTSFIIFYWLLVQQTVHLNQIFRFLLVLLGSGLLTGLYFLVTLFKVVSLPAWLSARNLISSSSNSWGLFLILLVVVALTILAIRRTTIGTTILAVATLLVSLAGIVLIGTQVVWIMLAVALGLSLIFFLTYLDQLRSGWSSIAFIILVSSILFAILGTPSWFTGHMPTEVNLGYSHSWSITQDAFSKGTWKNRLIGTGPATYIYDFSALRPAAVNLEVFWTSRFYHSASSALDWFTENGALSSLLWVGSMLIVLGIIFATWFKSIHDLKKVSTETPSSVLPLIGGGDTVSAAESPLIFWGVTASWLTLAVGLFVLNLGAAHWVLFWALTAWVVAASFALGSTAVTYKEISLRTSPQYALIISFSFILLFTGIIVLGIYFGRFIGAEVLYAKSTTAPVDERIALLDQAIVLNNNRSFFYVSLGDAWLTKANQLSVNQGQANDAYQALASSIQAAKTATTLAPNSVAGWQLLASAYTAAAAITPDAANWIGQALVHARELEPSNPVIYVALASVQATNKQFPLAIGDLNQAISLKPNFLEAYLRLALLQESQGNTDQALNTLERGFPYGKTNSDYLVQLGRYYFNRNKDSDEATAEALFQQAVYLNPNHSDGLFSLAVLKERQGKDSEALTLYRKVLGLNPGNKEIIRKINTLTGVGSAVETPPAGARVR